jgi:hypothetical protein
MRVVREDLDRRAQWQEDKKIGPIFGRSIFLRNILAFESFHAGRYTASALAITRELNYP